MDKFKTEIRIAIILSGLSLVGLLPAHLALTDIYHGGEPLAAEWTVVQIALFITVGCITFGLYTFIRIIKHLADLSSEV